MVMVPTAMMLEAAVPVTVPKRPEATMAHLAEPPRKRPSAAIANSLKKCEPCERISRLPKKMKASTTVTPISSVGPMSALESSAR
jgi:hypothetical protein